MHSALGELTDHTNQAIAFPIYGLAWPLGSTIGFVFHPQKSLLQRILTLLATVP